MNKFSIPDTAFLQHIAVLGKNGLRVQPQIDTLSLCK